MPFLSPEVLPLISAEEKIMTTFQAVSAKMYENQSQTESQPETAQGNIDDVIDADIIDTEIED